MESSMDRIDTKVEKKDFEGYIKKFESYTDNSLLVETFSGAKAVIFNKEGKKKILSSINHQINQINGYIKEQENEITKDKIRISAETILMIVSAITLNSGLSILMVLNILGIIWPVVLIPCQFNLIRYSKKNIEEAIKYLESNKQFLKEQEQTEYSVEEVILDELEDCETIDLDEVMILSKEDESAIKVEEVPLTEDNQLESGMALTRKKVK